MVEIFVFNSTTVVRLMNPNKFGVFGWDRLNSFSFPPLLHNLPFQLVDPEPFLSLFVEALAPLVLGPHTPRPWSPVQKPRGRQRLES